MKIKITTDSSSDISKDEALDLDVFIVPTNVILGDNEFQDGVNISTDDIFKFVAQTKTLPKTAATSEFAFSEVFKKFASEYDAILHISLSSKLSASNQNAANAAKNFNNVFVVDSLSLSSGVGLLVYKARELANDGKSGKEIADIINKTVPKVQASFVVEELDYLRKGGRCSLLQLLGANLFKIRPSLLLIDGKIIPGKKHRGKQSEVVKSYVNDIIEKNPDADKNLCYVTHTETKQEYIDIVYNAAKAAGFKTILNGEAKATITSHCGPGTIGLLFINR